MIPDVAKLPRSTRKYVEMYRVRSDSNPSNSYVVAKDIHGEWACSCPAWTQHYPRHNCKHINRVTAYLSRQAAQVKVMTEAEVQADTKLSKTLSRFSLLEV